MFDRRRTRAVVFRIHTWLGLHLCIVLAIIFATGTLLMFSPELSFSHRPDLWIKPADTAGPPASVGQIYDSVQEAQGRARIDIIATSPRPWFGRAVYGSGPDGYFVAHVNARTAELIGYGGGSTLRALVRQTHDSLLVPVSPGNIAVNFLSFIVLTMALSGLVTYRRFWKGYFRRPARDAGPRARRAAWHRLAGVWVAPFLIASALGSAVFFANSVGWKESLPPPAALPERAAAMPDTFDGAALDAIVAACRDRMSTYEPSVVLFPGSPADPLRIEGKDTARWGLLGGVACIADPATGAVSELILQSSGNAMATIKAFAVAIHFGVWAGWVSWTIWVVSGLLSVVLAVTGAQVYASRIAGGDTPARTWPLVIRGLGIFKWAYLALALGMGAIVVYRAFF